MILIGGVFYPEASKSLWHYCFGNGDTLFIKSNYISHSPVVLNQLKTMKVGQQKRVGFHQWEDWRLSYLINPFTITKEKNKIVITQWIEFSKNNEVKTMFGPLSISDNIVHTFKCTPFMFYYSFAY